MTDINATSSSGLFVVCGGDRSPRLLDPVRNAPSHGDRFSLHERGYDGHWEDFSIG
jgi:hypothetical protein